MGKSITILDAGAWGTAFGRVLADVGNTATMQAKEQQIAKGIRDHHHNAVCLSSIEKLSDNMTATGDCAEAVKDTDIVVVTTAVQFTRVALVEFKGLIPDHAIVASLMEGIERGTNRRMDEVVRESLDSPADRFAVISGPNLSEEIADRHSAATVVACMNLDNTTKVAEACTTSYFKPFVTIDAIDLEMCGSPKNMTVLAMDMARGVGYGENAAVMIGARGLAELTVLGVAAGADPKAFFGLAGAGDLIAAYGSSLSRNYTFGTNLGKGLTVGEVTKTSNGVVEDVLTMDVVVAFGDQLDVPTPLAYQMGHVLNEGISRSEMPAGLSSYEAAGE